MQNRRSIREKITPIVLQGEVRVMKSLINTTSNICIINNMF